MMSGCLMTPVMHFGSGKSAKEAQHDTLNSHLLPAQLAVEGAWKGEVKTATIRVYADDQYRAQNVRWKQTFDEVLEYANAVLVANFGVRLVAEYREWEHQAPAATLDEDLQELQQLDAGDDVLSVIGLTSSLGLVSATFDQIGYASVPGRHMMLRGYADVEERRAFAQAFPDLSQAERDNALVARRQHKTTSVLLHELAHNMGVDHDPAEDQLMSPVYSVHAADFGADAHRTILHALDQRLGRASSDDHVPVTASAKAAPAKPTTHPKMEIVLLAKGVMIDGKLVDDDSINVAFSMQAAEDLETEIVISKEKSVPSSKLIDLIDRAKAQGLKNVTFK